MKTRVGALFLCAITITASPRIAWAWGPLGHRMIAETAAVLLAQDSSKNTWGRLLSHERFALGYYAVLPDALFREEDGHGGKVEAPTHFFDLDVALGIPTSQMTAQTLTAVDAIPRVYEDFKARYLPKLGQEKFDQMGSSPWRAQQFVELAWKTLQPIQTLAGKHVSGEAASGDTQRVYQGLLYLGLLSHYSGDATMPYHAASDWDGRETGEAGIHFLFENTCVLALEPGISADVLSLARRERKNWLAQWGAFDQPPAGVMLRVLYDSASAIARVSRLDRKEVILSQPTSRKASFLSHFVPKRRPVEEACRIFRPLIVDRIARGAVLTAYLWQVALPKNIEPPRGSLLEFSDLQYKPEYVPPKY